MRSLASDHLFIGKPSLARLGLSAAVLSIAALAATVPASAQTVTAGGNEQYYNSDLPFGTEGSYAGEYQQIYTLGNSIPALSQITNIAFASDTTADSGNIPETANYPSLLVSLGYTTTAPSTNQIGNAATGLFVTPIDNTVVYNAPLTANILANGTFDLNIPTTSTPFIYDPTLGNLVLTVNLATPGSSSQSSVIDFINGDTDTTIGPTTTASASRIYYAGGTVGTPLDTDDGALYTQFTYTPALNVVPETSPAALVLAGGALLLLTAGLKARRRAMAA